MSKQPTFTANQLKSAEETKENFITRQVKYIGTAPEYKSYFDIAPELL
jgi:hypothetical protein